jgi:hypothetical protein
MSWLATFLNGLKYAARQFRLNPVLASVGVLSLSLGIGVNE